MLSVRADVYIRAHTVGTGITGFAAAALGAKVTVTDQEQILFLLQQNLESNVQRGAVPADSVRVAE
eukprot:COSAG01_NODE_564_length_15447_cov_14.174811_9_plen_66_part_00